MKTFHRHLAIKVTAAFLLILLLGACSKEDPANTAGDIAITALTASLRVVEAWDTTLITVEATGSDLQYGWEANHGDITGSGKTIKYAAGECCVGLNTITCRVFNSTGEVSDTIMIRVTPYDPVKSGKR
jgi:hypothetical protein